MLFDGPCPSTSTWKESVRFVWLDPKKLKDLDLQPPLLKTTDALARARSHIRSQNPPSRRHHVEADIGSLGLADWKAPGHRGQPGLFRDSSATGGS